MFFCDNKFMEIPERYLEIDSVMQNIYKRDWLITFFQTDKVCTYDPFLYLKSKYLYGTQYKMVIDRNIFQYVINSTRRAISTKDYRDAIGLLIFANIAEIEIEPNLAIYEKINYYHKNVDEAINELQDFYNIDNTNIEVLLNYVLEKTDKVNITYNKNIDKILLSKQLCKYERLAKWDAFYLFVLKMVSIYQDEQKNKFQRFVEWMSKEYIFSNIVLIYSIVLFFTPKSKMIKYKNKSTQTEKLQQIRNMTWDLYIMDQYLRVCLEKHSDEEVIFASNDKVVQYVLQLSIQVNLNENFAIIENFVSEKDYQTIQKMLNARKNNVDRVCDTAEWSREYCQDLIKSLEKELIYDL